MSKDDKEDPMIRFGGEWTPAHEVWKKMETANVVAAAIDRFNTGFPHLSSDETRQVVPLVRQRLKDIELRMPSKSPGVSDLGPIAADLLSTQSPEEVLETLQEGHDAAIDTQQLIQLAGEQAYTDALTREAEENEANGILPEQTARLWNDNGRPAPCGGLWTVDKVNKLLNHGY